MRSPERYRILDEPRPSAHERLIVDPVWPFFAFMLVGGWLAWPWFLANAWVLGSPTRLRECLIVVVSIAGSAAMLLAIDATWGAGRFRGIDPEYALLLVLVLKLGCGYALHQIQNRPYQLWRHFGGQPRNGLPLLVLAMVIGKPLVVAALGKGLILGALR